MPYIRKEFRENAKKNPIGSGELNFCLTSVILTYLLNHGRNYSTMNEIVGALEQVKDEFQRRVIHQYEDQKCVENGDVYILP